MRCIAGIAAPRDPNDAGASTLQALNFAGTPIGAVPGAALASLTLLKSLDLTNTGLERLPEEIGLLTGGGA